MSVLTQRLGAASLAAALFVLPPAWGGEADFQRIQDTIFTPHCITCHSGFFAPRGLRLDARNSYQLLVGMQSAEVPAVQRRQPRPWYGPRRAIQRTNW